VQSGPKNLCRLDAAVKPPLPRSDLSRSNLQRFDREECTLMTQTSSTAPPAKPAARTSELSPGTAERLSTDDGKISVAQSVVQKIAGIACREISGVHAMGVSTSRAYGAVRERIPGSSGPNVAQGVGVEVGESQAAIDLDIVVEYGVSIADLGRSIQRNVKQAVERMTGLDVVEVNINVDDLWMPGSDDQDDAPSRVS
jgi:uncharacterized alkaline shock family protein YloU